MGSDTGYGGGGDAGTKSKKQEKSSGSGASGSSDTSGGRPSNLHRLFAGPPATPGCGGPGAALEGPEPGGRAATAHALANAEW
jgi:hypothetical protein